MTTLPTRGPRGLQLYPRSASRLSVLCGALAVFCVFCVFCGSLLAQRGPAEQFIGHWRLVKFENFDDKGVARDAGYDGGRLVYDAAGNMSAQLMRTGRTPLSQPSNETERAMAYATFVAYYGRYSIDPATSKVTHAVEGALNPNWVKTDLVRYYEFSADGRRLMLSLRNPQGRITGTLTWERLP